MMVAISENLAVKQKGNFYSNWVVTVNESRYPVKFHRCLSMVFFRNFREIFFIP